MFSIKYLLLTEEITRLTNINNLEEFIMDFDTIEGQVELTFNNTIEGFVDQDIPYDGELIISWFKRFNEVILLLNTSNYVIMKIPDSNRIWLKFQEDENILTVSKIKIIEQQSICNLVRVEPISEIATFWEETINKKQFQSEVVRASKELLDTIIAINNILVDSSEYIELKRLYEEAREFLH